MGLLHSALKLVLWRRMGYYYLLATHPAIKTSGATSPQHSAAALPPFLSLSRSLILHELHTTTSLTLNSTPAPPLHRPKNHTQRSSIELLLLLPIGYSGCFPFFFFLFMFLWMGISDQCREPVNGLTAWVTDWQMGQERGSCGSSSKRQCWEVKRGATHPLRILEIQRHVRGITKLKVRYTMTTENCGTLVNVSRHVIYLDTRVVEYAHAWVCVRIATITHQIVAVYVHVISGFYRCVLFLRAHVHDLAPRLTMNIWAYCSRS